MDPFNPSIPPVTAGQQDNDAGAEEMKSDQRRAERARAFQQVMSKPAGGTAAGTQVATMASGGAAKLAGQKPGQGDEALSLSPAMLKLRAQGYPLAPQLGSGKIEEQQEDGAQAMEDGATVGRPEEQFDEDAAAVTVDGAEKDPSPSIAALQGRQHDKPGGQGSGGTSSRDSGGGRGSDAASAPDPRLLMGPVPVAGAPDFKPVAAQPAGRPVLPSPELVKQLVEFATIHRNQEGFMEFQLGLSRQALGGLRIQLSAYGNRRVGLAIKGGRGQSGVGEEEVAGLVEALRRRNVEVVDVVFGE